MIRLAVTITLLAMLASAAANLPEMIRSLDAERIGAHVAAWASDLSDAAANFLRDAADQQLDDATDGPASGDDTTTADGPASDGATTSDDPDADGTDTGDGGD